jgi:hypothetical protein
MDTSNFLRTPMPRCKTRRTGSDPLDASVGRDCFEPSPESIARAGVRGDPFDVAKNFDSYCSTARLRHRATHAPI